MNFSKSINVSLVLELKFRAHQDLKLIIWCTNLQQHINFCNCNYLISFLFLVRFKIVPPITKHDDAGPPLSYVVQKEYDEAGDVRAFFIIDW